MNTYLYERKFGEVHNTGSGSSSSTATQRMVAFNALLDDEEDDADRIVALKLFLRKAEELLDMTERKFKGLTAAATAVCKDVPGELTFLPIGEKIDRLAEELNLKAAKANQAARTRNMMCQTESAEVVEQAAMTTMSCLDGSFRVVECKMVDAEVMVKEVKCNHLIDLDTMDIWKQFRRLHYQRIFWRFRIRRTSRKQNITSPTGHCRIIVNAYIGSRGVFQRQIALLEEIKDVAYAYESYGLSYCRYVNHVNSRIEHLIDLMQDLFTSVFDFVYHIVRRLSLVPVGRPPNSMLYGREGAALKAKEESVRRMMKRKPWLFKQTLGDGEIPEEDALHRSDPQVPRLPKMAKLKTAGSPQSKRNLTGSPTQFGVAKFVCDTTPPDPDGARNPNTARLVESQAKRTKVVCSDCLRAKANKQPPACRTTGCAISKMFGTVERKHQFGLGINM